MEFSFTSLSMPAAALLASMIGAGATISAALMNIAVAWRKDRQAPERSSSSKSKQNRAPFKAMVILMIAAAVGGFALSQYFATEARKASEAAQSELRAQLDQLTISAQRLERVSLNGHAEREAQLLREAALQRGAEGSSAAIWLAPCVADESKNAAAVCTEKHALRAAVCAEIPPGAQVSEIKRYYRHDNDSRPWSAVQTDVGAELGHARFEGPAFERLHDSGTQVCQNVLSWDSKQGASARLLVTYTLP